jgi:hypothetical protein
MIFNTLVCILNNATNPKLPLPLKMNTMEKKDKSQPKEPKPLRKKEKIKKQWSGAI